MSNQGVEIRDLRQQDWLWTSKALLFHSEIDGNIFKVYCGLSSYADNKSQQAFPSILTLAHKLHMGRNTVIRAIQKLEELAFIKIERREGQHNIYYLLSVAADGAVSRPKPMKASASIGEHWVKEILIWAEDRKGAKFVNYGKQTGALGMMKRSGYTPDDIKACFELMEKSDFWRSRGFDFTNVMNELPKKVAQIRIRQGNGIFEHLTNK